MNEKILTEVHIIQVKVVDAPVLQRALYRLPHMRAGVERVPELGHDPHVPASHDAVRDRAPEALAAFLFVAVVCRTSPESAACPNVEPRRNALCDRARGPTGGRRRVFR